MALINCKECGKEISDKANTCPNCGAPVGNQQIGIAIAKDPNTVTHYTCKISKVESGIATKIGECKEGASIYFDCNEPMTLQFEIYFKKILQDVKPGEKYKLCFKPSLFNSKPYVIKVDSII